VNSKHVGLIVLHYHKRFNGISIPFCRTKVSRLRTDDVTPIDNLSRLRSAERVWIQLRSIEARMKNVTVLSRHDSVMLSEYPADTFHH
jgi:hypothetical protein